MKIKTEELKYVADLARINLTEKETELFSKQLNNILEYFLHEFKDSENWQDSDLPNILGDIRSKHQILRDIEQMANAYKHCIRKNQN